MFHNKDYIYSVYKERSFSKAAETCHISQPSLSAMVRKVEELAGAPIFERKTRPISLTPFGVEYISSVEQIYELEEHLSELAHELHTLQSGVLAVGGSNFSIPYKIPRRIAEFQRRYPKVELRIVEASTVQNKQMLDAGELDIIVTNRPLDGTRYKQVVCYCENLLLAVPSEFSVNKQIEAYRLSVDEIGETIYSVPKERCVPLKYMRDTPFVLLHNGNYLHECCEVMFAENEFKPIIALEVGKSSVAYNYANFGIGATIISNVLVEQLAKNSNLSFYKIMGSSAVRDAYVCYRRGRYLTSAMKRFVEMMTE